MAIKTNRLFTASCIALIATAMTFAIRASLLGPLGKEFNLSSLEMGVVSGTAFWGFTLSMIAGGFLCDLWGMQRLILFSFICHIAGIVLTILSSGFWSLFISTLFIGIANGFVEAACNPLVASMYTEEKTKRLNQFHMWFPGGIVIGGLVAYGIERAGLGWQLQVASIILPTLVYGSLFYKQKFPVTERVSAGVSTKDMLEECFKPLFIFMVFCMFLTAATELGTNQWITELLKSSGVHAILVLVFISGLMAVGRSMAGVIEKKLSPAGMLLFSAVFSTLGLLLLGFVKGYYTFGAAFIFAMGICYFWPTMLGFVSEYLPKTGALGLSVMGGAGMLSVSLVLPFIGKIYDMQTGLNIPDGYSMDVLKNALPGTEEAALWASAQLTGGTATLKLLALLPALLSVAFAFLYFYIKKREKSTHLAEING